jgi:hypothetical protein
MQAAQKAKTKTGDGDDPPTISLCVSLLYINMRLMDDGWIWADNRGGEGAMRLQFTDTERHDPPDSTLTLSQYG